ncbi:MAG TPA: beta-N-acetylhexosaminidase [Chitinophagaceae bacterium]
MRSKIFLFLLCCPLLNIAQQPLSLIPRPVEVKQQPGTYLLKNKITVSNSLPAVEWPGLFNYFKDEMKKQFGITVTEAEKGKKGDIDFFMKRMPTSGKPAYTIDVNKNGVSINSNFDEPTFHAMQTFFQLLPTDPNAKKEIPFVSIFDHARFNYRGMHFDVSRHFFPVSFVKKYIDYLAYHKLNKFHWHLTDDQGWRIEIKKYPLLTSVGSKRNGTIIGRYPGKGSDNTPYEGYFYTQEEIKEVVKYAKERFIEVIPEIEMPGHASAAIAAYPYLSCFPAKPTEIRANMISQKSVQEQKNGRIKLVQETWGVFDDVFCAGNDSVFQFLQNVIDEVMPLFPSKYFHIGGDECPKTHWKQCPRCQQRMKENGLKDEHELQSYFVQRMEKYLNSKGKTLLGWDEILEGGLAPNAIVMSWRGEKGGIEAAKQKHQVIMTPGNPVYFDHTQSENEDSVTIGGFNPIEKVYAYEPIPKELSEEEGKYILGAQANLWTEYIGNTRKVEYMLFPRLAALSEILWSTKENRDWKDFEKRLQTQFKRYDRWKANYSKAYYQLKATILPTDDHKTVKWVIASKVSLSLINSYEVSQLSKPWIDTVVEYDKRDISKIVGYKLDTTYESKKIIRYGSGNNPEEIIIDHSGTYKAESYNVIPLQGSHHFQADTSFTSIVTQKFHFNKATGRQITLKNDPSKKYPGDGAFTLVTGVQNEKGLGRAKEFIGYEGNDCEAVINLGVFGEISSVTLHTFLSEGSWIYAPAYFEVYSSQDNMYFSRLGTTSEFVPTANGNGKMTIKFDKTSTQYIKIFVKNYGLIPTGKPGEGHGAWLFIDEVEVL